MACVQGDFDTYLVEMSTDGAWGDHVTLQAAADVFEVNISLVTSYETDPVISVQSRSAPGTSQTLWLSFWAEIHYNSIEPVC